jgi:uncharacterized protein YprB with RNaseH-like and TPR domain/predicted nuclease with RNAse H fold/dephospho-CoA kinase
MTLRNNNKSILSVTFQHLPGIGRKKELEFWRSGISGWDDLKLTKDNQLELFDDIQNPNKILSELDRSYFALETANTEYFARLLPKFEYYRILLNFPENTLFLDIETTGLSRFYDNITIIGWSIENKYNIYIKGEKPEKLYNAFLTAKAVVTFNGSIFDIPFMKQEFPKLEIPYCHLDLRFLSRRVGFSGGQKQIENKIGFIRPTEIRQIKSESAPILWYRYRMGEEEALKQLIFYNYFDIEGMKFILDYLVSKLLKQDEIPVPYLSLHRFYLNAKTLSIKSFEHSQGKTIRIRKYKGKSGPKIHFNELEISNRPKILKIVGIDLTGSEKRASGWCLLEHDYARTKRLFTEQQIIEETMEVQPDIISIDSPLSIPVGRISFRDDDPGRERYGITRLCERILKKRGINVYPCLIPSMQKLTERGMKLAKHLRSNGIPVIESYPGAAQDIIDIPRKRASIEYLKKGIEKFGIRGDFINQNVSHDELDAITSAIVGLFFWSGKFEALGNEEEDYLIIPDLIKSNGDWLNRKVVGISGPIAAGKTTAGRFLESMGFVYARYSLVLEKILKEQGIEVNRESLQRIGEEVNIKGQRWLCEKLVLSLPQQGNLVIDGLRFPDDHSFLKERFGPGFLHVHLTATEELRRQRYMRNGMTNEDFTIATSHNVERKVNELAKLADLEITNDTDLNSFHQNILDKTDEWYSNKQHQ